MACVEAFAEAVWNACGGHVLALCGEDAEEEEVLLTTYYLLLTTYYKVLTTHYLLTTYSLSAGKALRKEISAPPFIISVLWK